MIRYRLWRYEWRWKLRDAWERFAPWWLHRCNCRSYHERTGEHADGCPRL